MKKTVLVTGGCGFIGSNYVKYLMKNHPDYRILVLDSLTYAGSIENLPEEFRLDENDNYVFWYGDVRNAELVNTLVGESDAVVHFAAETHVTRSIYDNKLFYETDVLGTHTIANAVLKAGKNIQKFIHISTSEVYGTAIGPTMTEEHPLNPMSPYASAKCGADRLVYSYYQTYQIPAVIVRPFNNYGPFQHLEKVVPRFITSILLDEPLPVHGDGMSARDFIYVEDTCSAIDTILHSPDDKVVGEVFNVSSGEDRTILSIAKDLLKIFKGPDESSLDFIQERPGQVIRHTGDNSKIKKVLGWSPAYNWEQGLAETINWYKDNSKIWDKQIWMRKIPLKLPDGNRCYH